MIVLTINNKDYRIFESWKEITLPKAKEIYKVALTIPEELNEAYRQKAKGKDCDNDQVEKFLKELEAKEEELHKFYCNTLRVLCFSDANNPKLTNKVIHQINKDDLVACYDKLLMPLIFGSLYYPLEDIEDIESFTTMGEEYFRPESKEVMNIERPLYYDGAGVFCDASDIDNNSKKNKVKFDYAELIISIIYRKKDEVYNDKVSLERAKVFSHLTCDVYHSAIHQLSKTNIVLKELFPNLFEKGNNKNSKHYKASGLDDFGWFNSLKTVAQMGIFNQEGLTALDSVRKTDLYDLMTVLSNLKAETKFNMLLQENVKK